MKEVRAVGSSDHAAQVAARAFLERGCTNLETKIASHVASYGDVCWQTDRALHEALRRPDGRQYHRESIGRARRNLALLGFLRSRRVFPGQRPDKKAKYISAHGTTAKSIAWSMIGLSRSPMIRGERRRARQRQEEAPARSVAPRYSATPPEPVPTLAPGDPLAVVMADTARALSRRWVSSSAPADDSTAHPSAPGLLASSSTSTGPPE